MDRPETMDHEGDARIEQAAEWLSLNFETVPRPLLPHMRKTFGISSAQAITAIRQAHVLRAGRAT